MKYVKRFFRLYSLPVYTMVRPFNGFYEMKHEKKGTLRMAFFNLFMVCFSVAFSNQFTSFIVRPGHPLDQNSIRDFQIIITALVVFCVANWSVTCLANGEGKFLEIFMAICYAMTPIVLTFIPAAILSNFLAAEEAAFFYMIRNIAVIWFVFLAFLGLISIHNFGVAKAVWVLFLTFIAILVIVFLVTLFFAMFNELVGFIYSIYTELVFRAA
jgi:hypothetical protein